MTETEYLDQISGEDDCPICGWDAATIHTNIHRKRCRMWQRACKSIDYTPMTRPEAKVAIGDARENLDDADSKQEEVSAALELVRALYDRSLALAISNKNANDHPDYWEYVSMLDLPEIPQVLRTRFPYKEGHIAPGFTIWEPPKSKMRRIQFRTAERRQRHAR
ncbi:MAG: hypothetical protein CMH57_00300 [Myxococcales bacterium]|nr:hypothetical protein [Myxococcales bacterium]